MNLTDFCDKVVQDFAIGSGTDGTPFIKSNVAKLPVHTPKMKMCVSMMYWLTTQ